MNHLALWGVLLSKSLLWSTRAWKHTRSLLEAPEGSFQSVCSLNPRVLSGRLPVTGRRQGDRKGPFGQPERHQGSRKGLIGQLVRHQGGRKGSIGQPARHQGGTKEAGKNHLDSLGGTREAPGRQERTTWTAWRHQGDPKGPGSLRGTRSL